MKTIMLTLILSLSAEWASAGDRSEFLARYLADPVLVTIAPPEYPPLALQFALQGRVEVMLWIDQDGTPSGARIFESSSVIFEQPALTAALQSRFSPALGQDGRPVASLVRIPFVFRLR